MSAQSTMEDERKMLRIGSASERRRAHRQRSGFLLILAWALSVSLSLVACRKDEVSEAERLHELLSGLESPELSVAARKERLEAVRALHLNESEHRAVRDACLKLHASLIAAEEATREATPRLDALEKLPLEERPAEEEEAIRQLLVQSHEALREAEGNREACLGGMMRLER